MTLVTRDGSSTSASFVRPADRAESSERVVNVTVVTASDLDANLSGGAACGDAGRDDT